MNAYFYACSGGLTWGQKGRLPPLFFLFAPFLKTLPRLKLPLLAFTHYLLWGLKNLPPLNFKLSPPLYACIWLDAVLFVLFETLLVQIFLRNKTVILR